MHIYVHIHIYLHIYIYLYIHIYKHIYIYISSHPHLVVPLARISLTNLSPLFPIVHRLWQVFRATPRILTKLLNVCSFWSSCFCPAICRGP